MTYNRVKFIQDVQTVVVEVSKMLIEKNDAYGDSALNPVRIFSKAPTTEQILVRMDDKLSRLARGQAAGEDVIKDLLGYLVLYRIAKAREANPTVHNERLGIKFNGSVTDLATDVAYEITKDEGQKLAEELLRFLSQGMDKFKKVTVHNERCRCRCQQCRVDKSHSPDICGCPQGPHMHCPVTKKECDQPCVGAICNRAADPIFEEVSRKL